MKEHGRYALIDEEKYIERASQREYIECEKETSGTDLGTQLSWAIEFTFANRCSKVA